MNIAIYGRPVNVNQISLAENVFETLEKSDCRLLIHEPYFHFLKRHISSLKNYALFNSSGDLQQDTDFLFSIGGDGTLLDTIKLVKDSKIPIVGLNAGRLGFSFQHIKRKS